MYWQRVQLALSFLAIALTYAVHAMTKVRQHQRKKYLSP